MSDSDEVMLGYASSKNVTFRGEISTGMTRAEWDALTPAEQDDLVEEVAAELVDIWVVGE